jgi:membrane associated rhomboid family serine protease
MRFGSREPTASRQQLGETSVFVPLWDLNPLENVRFQWVTLGLVLTNTLVFLLFQVGILASPSTETLVSFAVIPAELIGQGYLGEAAASQTIAVPERLTLLTYMFLHGNILHLVGNMLFLWVFGDNVEDAMGHVRFLLFYLLCGIFAGLAHAFMRANSDVPMIGASGAVAGVIAAYLMLHPNVRVWILALFRIPLRVSAGFALLVWIGLQIISVVFDQGGGTAWWAHIGGLIAGAVLVLFMRRPGIPLFDRSTGLPS